MDDETIVVAKEKFNQQKHEFFHPKYPSTEVVKTFSKFMGESHTVLDTFDCLNCGAHPYWLHNDGKYYLRNGEDCLWFETSSYELELEVTSGAIVFSDNLFNVFPRENKAYSSINSFKGMFESSKVAEAQGFIYGPGVYGLPTVFVNKATDEIIVGDKFYDEEADEESYPVELTELATISCDLWAYCITDAKRFEERGGKLDNNTFKHEIPNGTYKFTHTPNNDDLFHEKFYEIAKATKIA